MTKLSVHNFRSFEDTTFSFNPFLTVILGKNSVGKTNLMEAVYFLLQGRGIKEEKQDELIRQHAKHTILQGEFTQDDAKTMLRVELEEGESLRKTYAVNSIKKRLQEYGQLTIPAVIFTPQLVDVIDGEPSLRRKFIDVIIATVSIEYKKRLRNYENGLTKRNKILERTKDLQALRQELAFWDKYLIEQAEIICRMREEVVQYLNSGIQIKKHVFKIDYLKNEISEITLAGTFEKQLYIKRTLVGPQRDLYNIYKIENGAADDKIDIHKFGSRSEQRLALFWLILNEMRLYQERLEKRPLLLLDDIFSELDAGNRALVVDLIKKYQTIITTTDREILDLVDMPNTVIELS